MRNYRLASLTAAALLTFGGATIAAAQSDEVTANVPFSFIADGVLLPAGHYSVRADATRPDVWWIGNTQEPDLGAVVLTQTAPTGPSDHADLVFDTVGNRHLLARIEVPGEDGRFVPLTRSEIRHELEQAARRQEMAGRRS